VIISGFKFDKDTGRLTDFERDNALQAANQLRDMHGFKAPAKTEMTGPGGGAVLHGLDRDTVVRLLEQLVAVRARRIGDETKNVEGN